MLRRLTIFVALFSIAAILSGASRAPVTPPVKTLRGEIGQVDIERKTFTVISTLRQQKKETAFTTDDNTVFLLDDEQATIVDLRKWMRVTVTPDTGTATRVVAKSLTPAEIRKRKQQEGQAP